MSGTKHANLEGSQRREARQRLGAFVQLLQAQAAACASIPANEKGGITELDTAARSIRAELAQFKVQAGARRDMLDAARTAEQTLARLSKSPVIDAAEFTNILHSIERLIAGTSAESIESLELSAHELLARGAVAEATQAEIQTSTSAIRDLLSAANPKNPSQTSTPTSISAAAERMRAALDASASSTIRKESDAASAMSLDAQRFQTLLASQHAGFIDAATRAVANGKHEAATAAVSSASQLRIHAEHKAAELRQKIIERDVIAAELAHALQQRNFDKCHVYLQEPARDETAPLVIYAHNPLESGHVRVTIALDGKMTVEVDGVAEGEEQICLDALGTITDSLARLDETLTIQDFGRAGYIRDRVRATTTSTEIERGRLTSS